LQRSLVHALPMTISLGPFDLIRPVGRGGMGTVWRGLHRTSGTPVAVKTFNPSGRQAHFQRAFRGEVRALAGLHHPHVVQLFGHGIIDGRAADAAEGRLVEGSAYLVMEFASGGTLSSWAADGRPWPVVRDALLALLDALAHTHARGLVHRDIKPANVLLCTEADLAPGLRLTDFGLAHLSKEGLLADRTSGTPSYMAPEQFRPAIRLLGPWTDLYALGCLAWRLTTGRALYLADSPPKMALAHLRGALPVFTPRTDVPAGLRGWLETLLQTSPFQRASSAARAATDLRALGEPTVVGSHLAGSRDPDPTTVVTLGAASASGTLLEPPPVAMGAIGLPFVHDWRRPERALKPYLEDVGLGIFGMRSVPMVDRDAERGALWAALGTVVTQRQPKIVLLEGEVGTGRRRLGSWIGHRASELGLATVWKVRNQAQGGAAQGVGPALSAHYNVGGVPTEDLAHVLRAELAAEGVRGPWMSRALAEILVPGSQGIHFEGPHERRVVLHGVLDRATQRRPLLLLVEEPQLDGDTMALLQHIVRHDLPVLVVATSGEDGWCPLPPERLAVPPLGAADSMALVTALLHLQPNLAREVSERSEGVPLFAVQLIGDWVQREALVAEKGG
jgi:eukaryotic-like serine/threonine-protein kinase